MDASQAKSSRPAPAQDLLTIIAVGVLAYIVQDFLHESAGHGGMSVLFGGHPLALSAIFYRGDQSALAEWQGRMVSAAGSLMNFLIAAGCYASFRWFKGWSPAWRYFLWVSLVLNLFAEGSYMALCWVFGDWQAVCARACCTNSSGRLPAPQSEWGSTCWQLSWRWLTSNRSWE